VSSNRLADAKAFFEVFFHDAMWSAERDQAAVGTYRPVALASFVIDFQLWGRRAAGFHFTSVLWHALTTLAVFRACLRWMPGRTAWLLAAIWCAHPVGSEAVAWINGRSETFCVLFGAAGIALASNGKNGLTPLRWLGVALCMAFALFSKETGLIFVPVIVLLGAEASKAVGRSYFLGLGLSLLAVLVGAAAYFYMRHQALKGGLAAGVSLTANDINALPSIWLRSLRTVLLPLERSLQHLSLWLRDLPDSYIWAGRVSSGLLIMLGLFWFATGKRVAAIGLAWWMGALVPVCIIATKSWPGFHRWLVIGLPGLLLCIQQIGKEMLPNKGRKVALGLLGIAVLLTQFTIPVWRTGGTLFAQMVDENPEISYGYIGLGAWLLEVGRDEEAEQVLRKAVALRNPRPDAFYFLARAIASLERCDEAMAMSENRSVGNVPGHVAYSIGRCYHITAQWAKAVDAYGKCAHYAPPCASQLPVVQKALDIVNDAAAASQAPASDVEADDTVRVVGTVGSATAISVASQAPTTAAPATQAPTTAAPASRAPASTP
jgi:tetratricopeptide (TPR) repeat protein